MDRNPGWHEADAIYPEEQQLVLLWDGRTYGFGTFDLEEGWTARPDGLAEPTHWAYLPPPPP